MIVVLLTGCEAKIEEFKASGGSANFETIVFVGNSLTAGYRDGALFPSGQRESYPAIIHEQLFKAGLNTKEFKQPYMADEAGLGGRRVLGPSTDCLGNVSLGPVLSPLPVNQAANIASIAADGPYNNMGIPGAKVSHVLFSGYATRNPYFGRIATSPTATVAGMAQAQNATFVVTWLGNNDALYYATTGGAGDTLTSIGSYTGMLNIAAGMLYGGGAKGAICNIPPITAAPFFTTIKPNALTLNEAQVAGLTAAYASYNQAASVYGFAPMSFTVGANFFIIQDLAHPVGMRQVKANEMLLLTLPQDSLKCAGWGTAKPIPHQYVLDTAEIASVNTAVAGYNAAIAAVATQHDLALVDMNQLLSDIAARGIRIDGQAFSTTFVTGQLFSLDGVHLTGKGYAIVANHIIKAVNAKYNANIPQAIVHDYTGIEFP
jgi:lysophospholipase L1-like esterase